MRILHITHQYLPDHIGGVELNTQGVARGQAARGHTASVLFRRSGEGTGVERWVDEAGVTVWAARSGLVTAPGRFAATFHADETLLGHLDDVLAATGPDVVHVQHLMGWPAAVGERLRARGVPYVVTLHDYWWVCANAQLLTNDTEEVCEGPRLWVNCGRCALARAGRDELWAAPALAPLFAWRQRRLRAVLDGAAALLAPTPFTCDLYGRLLGLRGVRVLPNGIPLPPSVAHGPSDPHRAGLHVAYVGGIAPQKGVHVLVRAVRELPGDVQLTLYGDLEPFPDYVAELRALADERVTFAGRVPNETLPARLAGADVVVVPSLWYETAALVIQEAFALGIPVVASDLGALRDRVRHGVDGLRVPPGDVGALRDALRRLRDEPGLRQRLRAGIRPVATLDDQVRALEAVYREVVEEGRPRKENVT